MHYYTIYNTISSLKTYVYSKILLCELKYVRSETKLTGICYLSQFDFLFFKFVQRITDNIVEDARDARKLDCVCHVARWSIRGWRNHVEGCCGGKRCNSTIHGGLTGKADVRPLVESLFSPNTVFPRCFRGLRAKSAACDRACRAPSNSFKSYSRILWQIAEKFKFRNNNFAKLENIVFFNRNASFLNSRHYSLSWIFFILILFLFYLLRIS